MSIWFILWSLHVVDSLLITKKNIIKSSETSLDLGIHCAELQYLKSCPIASPVQLRSNIPSILQFSFLCFALWRPRTSFTESTWKDLSEYNQTPNVLTTYINIWQTLDLEPDNVLRASTQRKYQTKSSWKQSWVSMFDVAIIFHDIPWSFKRSFTIPNIDRIFLDYCNIAFGSCLIKKPVPSGNSVKFWRKQLHAAILFVEGSCIEVFINFLHGLV